MTTELVLLLGLFAFLLLGVFLGENGPRGTFEKAGPSLGARLEQQITIGYNGRDEIPPFNPLDGSSKQRSPVKFNKPNGAAPDGEFQ